MDNVTLRDENEILEWSRVVVSGPARVSFLQGQLSQDLEDVTDEGCWSLLLHPTSEVLTTCWVSSNDDTVSLVVPRSLGESTLTRLKRFHLRVDCTLDLQKSSVGPFATLGEQIDLGQPGPREFVGLVPQAYGATFVSRSVSFTKGCFTGQELVARLDARSSSVPWRFVRAVGASIDDLQAALARSGPTGPKGVTSAVGAPGSVRALGFIHRSAVGSFDDATRVELID